MKIKQKDFGSILLAGLIMFTFSGQTLADVISLTCQTQTINDKPSQFPVFTAKINLDESTILWEASGFNDKITKVEIKENQFIFYINCDNSNGLCLNNFGAINRLSANFFYNHVHSGETLWTKYEGNCESGINRKF